MTTEIPETVPVITVTMGQYLDQSGRADWSGTVTFTPSGGRLHLPTGTPFTTKPIEVPIVNGRGTIDLIASDAPDMTATNIQYRVSWNLKSGGKTVQPNYPRNIYLPQAIGPTVDLDLVNPAPAVPPGGVAFPTGVLRVAGLGGDVQADALASALAVPRYPSGESAPFTSRPKPEVDLRDFGVNGEGVHEFTAAVKSAMLQAAGLPIIWPAGTVVIDGPLANGPVGRTCWRGARSERGANAIAEVGLGYSATRILYLPGDVSKPLFRTYDTAVPTVAEGPFEFSDLTFDLGSAHGFVIGVEDPAQPDVLRPASPPTVTVGAGEKTTFGARFVRCAFNATPADRTSTSGGVITRSGQHLLSFTKGFEVVVEDCSLYGGDVQVRTFGCDRPVFSRIRSQGAHLPFDLEGSGIFSAQHVLSDVQIEGWTLCPVRTRNVEVAASRLRLEQNDGASPPVGSGRWALPGTVTTTADSQTLIFSQSMTGVLFPGVSIVELADGIRCLVTSVSGTTVTVDAATTVTTTGSTTATRIHGVGPMHSGVMPAAYDNASPGASAGCPSFVWIVGRGDLAIFNAVGIPGSYGDITAAVIGNHHGSQANVAGVMSFSGCSPMITPDPSNPFVVVNGVHAPYGLGAKSDFANNRPPFGGLAEAEAVTRRRWVFTPKNACVTGDGELTPVVELADEASTTQKVWAWQKRTQTIGLHDATLPSRSTTWLRIRVRARSVASTGTVSYVFSGSAGSSATDIAVTNSFATYERVVQVPAVWQGTRTATGIIGFAFFGTGYYLAGVTVEEIAPPTITGSKGSNAALTSLLAGLAASGFIVDSTN